MGKTLFKLVGLLIIIATFAGAWLVMDIRVFISTPLSVSEARNTVTVAPGATAKQLANDLRRNGFIENPVYFEWLARWRGHARNIKAGEYRVESEMLPERFLESIVAGNVIQHALTIVEGWTFKQLLDAISAHPRLEQTLAGLTHAQIMEKLGAPGENPEGRFNPDTYHFPSGTSDFEFLQRAYNEMAAQLQTAWEGRAENLPLNTPYEALILASIVERETAVSAERDKIAGVFVRRLQKGMRLQTDPTVIYGMGDAYKGNIRRKDLLKDTPYNTYTRKGLPPTPIAMPSKASIEAALHPDDSQYLYFVARGDGSHYFSATLEEHNKAVREYQILRPRRERQAKRTSDR